MEENNSKWSNWQRINLKNIQATPAAQFQKNKRPNQKMEKEMATHSSILAWRILWIEEPGGLLSMGSHRVGHDWSNLACMHALEKEMATHSSILAWRVPGTEEPGRLLSMGLHRVRHDWSDFVGTYMKSFSHVCLFATPWTVAYRAPLSMGFSRQFYWSGLPFPSPKDLPNPGIEPRSPALLTDALLSEPPGKWL